MEEAKFTTGTSALRIFNGRTYVHAAQRVHIHGATAAAIMLLLSYTPSLKFTVLLVGL